MGGVMGGTTKPAPADIRGGIPLPDMDAIGQMKDAATTDAAAIDMTMLDQLRRVLMQARDMLAPPPDPADGNEPSDETQDPVAQKIDALEEVVEIIEQEQTKRLNDLAMKKMADFGRAVTDKKDVEARMIDDERQYAGKKRVRDSKAYATDAGSSYDDDIEGPQIHATRNRTEMITARLIDMLLPTHDMPYRVDAANEPDPECFPQETLQAIAAQAQQPPQQQQGGPPQPPVRPDVLLKQACDAAASKLQDTIADQLSQQGLQKHGRRCISDACRIGIGLVKGPFVAYRRHHKTKGGQADVVVEERPIPGLDYVNPWFFYYDMMPTLAETSCTYEVHLYDRRKLMDLKRYPRVIAENVDELLEDKEPQLPPTLAASITLRNKALENTETTKGRWAVIECHGVLDPDVLKDTMGVEWTDENSLPLIEFWFCNGKALKWKLSPLECDWRVPYYNFTPFPIDDTIFGGSIPYMARSSQRTLDAAWDATLTNASVSAGPFLFFKKGVFQPVGDNWRLRGPQAFSTISDMDGPIGDAFADLMFPSNVEGNLQLCDRAESNMDNDTLYNQFLAGDITKVGTDTPASALVQRINLATIVQRMMAAHADDHWFQPMSERWGWWNQLYNPDPGVKGDFEYRGIAASALVSRDIQVQHTQVLTQMAADPRFAGFCDDYDLFEANANLLDIPNKDSLLKDKADALAAHAVAMQQNIPPEVALQQKKLELETQSLQVKMQEVQFAHQERMAEIQRQVNKDQDDAQLQKADIDARVLVANANLQSSLANVAAKKDVDIAKLGVTIRNAAMDDGTKRFLAAMELTKTGRQEAQKTAREIGKEHVKQQTAVKVAAAKPQGGNGADTANP